MLCLSLKPGEKLVLPGLGVTITVVAIAGQKVRIGIDAPRHEPVHRQEIYDRIAAEMAALTRGA